MSKEFDFYKLLIVLVVLGAVIALVGVVDFSGISDDFDDFDSAIQTLKEPLDIKNWHYFLLLLVVFISRDK